ncbi:unnamed protein product [Anisakis simplex]|uniref:Cadherin domain-containing protein n=1 Tax=Anisakis simplex TaxID=6269 RepID=A0A0M3JCH3_ANISI|nr:unnamed protein product [Anisakis simplex]
MKLQQQGSAIKLLCEDVLDRERVPAYKLLLEAEDCGRPARKSLKMISIIVDDENDNAPLCAGADHILLEPPQPNGPQKPFQVKLQCFDLDQDEDQSSLNGLLGYELLISDGATDWTDKVASDNVDKSDNGRTDDKVRLHGDMLTIDMRLHQTTAPFSFAVRVFDRFNARSVIL